MALAEGKGGGGRESSLLHMRTRKALSTIITNTKTTFGHQRQLRRQSAKLFL